ncbi:MAG: hypothetical protein DRN88_04170 [Candidatus Hydrothermarchaeota archaeon]|nr:MAG: hypothetical protein DRN88_04170 [Candidatus Hydrothermarchaeota archaeon]
MRRRMKSKADKVFLLTNFSELGNELFIYEGKEEKYYRFLDFLDTGKDRNEVLIYIYPNQNERFNFYLNYEKYYEIPIINRKIRAINARDLQRLKEEILRIMEKEKDKFRLIIDYGIMVNKRNVDIVVEFEEFVHENGISISALEAKLIEQEIVKKLLKIHDKAVISTKEGTSVSFPRTVNDNGMEIPNVDVVSSETLEQCVKKSLDIIVLSLLLQRPMCGFDIIKTIVQNFNVLLSQGTVYPILYELKEKGYVTDEKKEDNKTRIYIPTEEGVEYMQKKISEYLLAQESILNLIMKR